ncbi:MAG: hypothetical protein QXS32_07645 [Candidatus Nezhaarchaeales archaeon]
MTTAGRQAVKQASRTSSWLVTIVTSKKYTKERFVEEARRMGVSRLCNITTLQTITSSTPLFVADFISSTGKRAKVLRDGDMLLRIGNETGTLVIFGYFYPTAIALQADNSVFEQIKQHFNITKISKANKVEVRGCGTVQFSEVYSTNATIDELKTVLIPAMRRGEVRKVFLRGELHLLSKPVILQNIDYFRGFKRFEFELPQLSSSTTQTASDVHKVSGYEPGKRKDSYVISPLS